MRVVKESYSMFKNILALCICTNLNCDLICKNPEQWIFSFLHFCVICALSFVILNMKPVLLIVFKLHAVLGSSRCIILYLYPAVDALYYICILW